MEGGRKVTKGGVWAQHGTYFQFSTLQVFRIWLFC